MGKAKTTATSGWQKIAFAIGVLSSIMGIAAFYLLVYPEWLPGVRRVMPVVSTALLVMGIGLSIWGLWPRLSKLSATSRAWGLGGVAVAVAFFLGWGWAKLPSQSTEEPKASIVRDSTYFAQGYMSESDALKIVWDHAREVKKTDVSGNYQRSVLERGVSEDSIHFRFRRIGAHDWRIGFPPESLTIIFEVAKYGSRGFTEEKLFEREYWNVDVLNYYPEK